ITSVMVAGLLIAAVLLTIEFLLGLPNSGSAAGVDGAAGGAAGGGGSFLASVGLALLTSGIVMMAAGAVAAGLAIAAKWICAGPIKAGEHPLWSSFIWRNEVADCFVELIAAPWFARNAVGHPPSCGICVPWARRSATACGVRPTGCPWPTSSASATTPRSTAAAWSRRTSSTTG
ncbi:hypothetical protein, partial [Streptomyces canarius]